ncbi:hypothetical protein ILUMI_11226, partial [Ignelater luminosus]
MTKRALDKKLADQLQSINKLDRNNARDIQSSCSNQTDCGSNGPDKPRQEAKASVLNRDIDMNSSKEEPFSAEKSNDYIPSASEASLDSNLESFEGYTQGPCSITTEVHENQSYDNDME